MSSRTRSTGRTKGSAEPRELARAAVRDLVRPPGPGERFSGYGVMGQPFTSGHYLAFRHFPASPIGPGYRAVWHRDPQRRWTVYADAPPSSSCARYLGPALTATVRAEIGVGWTDERTLAIEIDHRFTWEMEVAPTVSTRLLSAVGGLLPERAVDSDWLLRAMGVMAGPMLGVGRVVLVGEMPAGQHFDAMPRRVWSVRRAHASLDGSDLGPIGPLPEPASLGDFRLPQRGIFFAAGIAAFSDRTSASIHRSCACCASPSERAGRVVAPHQASGLPSALRLAITPVW